MKEYVGDFTLNIETAHLIIQVGSLQRPQIWPVTPIPRLKKLYRVGF